MTDRDLEDPVLLLNERPHISFSIISCINMCRRYATTYEHYLRCVVIDPNDPQELLNNPIARLVRSFSSLAISPKQDMATAFMSLINQYVYVDTEKLSVR